MSTFAAVFVALLVGHQLGDHLIQTDAQSAAKAGRGWPAVRAMAGHVGGYLLAQAIALGLVAWLVAPLPAAGCAVALAVSGVTHAVIDHRWPVRWLLVHTGSPTFAERVDGGWPTGMYHADQALHIGCLFVAALLVGAR